VTQIRGYAFAYKFGFVFFMAGSTICALSHGIHLLIFGRIVQAVGTAMFARSAPVSCRQFSTRPARKGNRLDGHDGGAGFMVGPPLGGMMLSFYLAGTVPG